MRVFLTGATGFIGGRLVGQLLEAGHEVRALVRTPAKAGHLEAEGVELVPGDVTDPRSLEAGVEGCTALVHGAAYYELGPVDREFMTRVNVQGTRNVLQAARHEGVGRVVYLSSIAAKGDTGGEIADESWQHGGRYPHHYERTKAEAHAVAREFAAKGLPLRIVMPGVVYGPGDQSAIMGYFRDYVRERLPARVGEDTVQSFVHVDDVADGIMRVLEDGADGEEYLLAGHPHSFRQVNALLEELTGIRPPAFSLPMPLARAYAACSEAYGHVMGRKVLVTRESIASMDSLCYLFDSSKAIEGLGWRPRPLEEGLRPTLEALGVALRGPRGTEDAAPEASEAAEAPEEAAPAAGAEPSEAGDPGEVPAAPASEAAGDGADARGAQP